MRLNRPALLIPAGLAALAVLGLAVILIASSRPHGRVLGPGPRALPPPAVESFGVNVNRLFNDFTFSQSQIDLQLTALQATGATIARSDALWEASEPQAPVDGVHHYDWSFDDRIAGSLAAHGLRWLPIIDYSAGWAQSIRGVDHSPPSSSADYAAYAASFAKRYGAGGTFWRAHPQLRPLPVNTFEIWNEPDNPEFWRPEPSAAGYARLYTAARNAIKSADPQARVIVGGLTAPVTFLPAMLAAQPALRTRIDGVAIHPYGADPDAVLTAVSAARAALDTLGMDSTPLYVTEFGWVTHPAGALDYAPSRLRATYIEQTMAALGHTRCELAVALLYTWVTPMRDLGDLQDWYGISPPAGGVSAAMRAFSAGLRSASAGGGAQGGSAGGVGGATKPARTAAPAGPCAGSVRSQAPLSQTPKKPASR